MFYDVDDKNEAEQEARKSLVSILTVLATESPTGLLWCDVLPNSAQDGSMEIAYRADGQIRLWVWDGKTNHNGAPMLASAPGVPLAVLASFIEHHQAPEKNMNPASIDQTDFEELIAWAANIKKPLNP